MDQPKIPTLKDSQKPQVKVRGLGAGLSFFDRMKQFNKKDLAFILAGLGTLFMAPLAEHFMMSPDNGDASLSPGFGSGKGAGPGIFGAEDRTSDGYGTAVGSPVGGSDVITPLNVRDPSSLIMGPGSSSQPPTSSSASVAPPVGAPGRSDQDVRDALAGAASHAAGAAVNKSLLPVPKIGLSGSSLRGLGVATGNSSATAGGGVSTQGLGLGGHGNVANNMAGVKGGDKIASVGPRGLTTGADALTALKAAGDKAGGLFDRAAGSAQGNLNAAASEAIPSGGGQSAGGGSGPGGAGPGDKPGNGGGPKDSKSGGESLAYELMKQNLQKQLELYWKEQEIMDPTLELYKMRNTMAEAVAGTIGTSIGNVAGALINGVVCQSTFMQNNDSSCFQTGYTYCNGIGGDGSLQAPTGMQKSMIGMSCGPATTTTSNGATTGGGAGSQFAYIFVSVGVPPTVQAAANKISGGQLVGQCGLGPMPGPPYMVCGGSPNPSPTNPTTGPNAIGQIDNGISGAVSAAAPGLAGIDSACTTIKQFQSKQASTGPGPTMVSSSAGDPWLTTAQQQMQLLAQAQAELTGASACGVAGMSGNAALPLRQNAISAVQSAMSALAGSAISNQKLSDGQAALQNASGAIIGAAGNARTADGQISDALSKAGGTSLNSTNPNYTNIITAFNNGKSGISTLATSVQTAQQKFEAGVLADAERTVTQGPPANPTAPAIPQQLPDPSTAQAAPPTLVQVLTMNSLADNLNTAITKINTATPAPSTQLNPPQLQAAGQNGGASSGGSAQTDNVDPAVTKAYTAIAQACGAIGYKPDCSAQQNSSPAPAATVPASSPQAMIDAVAQPVVAARGVQQNTLKAINTEAQALTATPPAAAGPGH